MQQQAALMAAATAQGTYINPMAALATQIPHATLNGMANPVVPPTSGRFPRNSAYTACTFLDTSCWTSKFTIRHIPENVKS